MITLGKLPCLVLAVVMHVGYKRKNSQEGTWDHTEIFFIFFGAILPSWKITWSRSKNTL